LNKTILKSLVNNEGLWLALVDWLETEEKVALANLLQAEKPELLYRSQGYVQAIRKMKGLKSHVNA